MIALFISPNIEDVLTYLDDPNFDYMDFDSQLFRELHSGRRTVAETLRIYEKLVEKHNYTVTSRDLQKMIFYLELYHE